MLSRFRQYYLFNDDASYPGQTDKYAAIEANLAAYPDVDALLDALRYQSGLFDRGFSYYATVEAVEQFYSAGEFVGFGFSVGIDAGGAWRLIDVYAGSPASDAGWQRGDTILQVNGTSTTVLDLNDPSYVRPCAGRCDPGIQTASADGSEAVVVLEQAHGRSRSGTGRSGAGVRCRGTSGRLCLLPDLHRGCGCSIASGSGDLVAQGVDDLVIDVRYNGGGLVDTAEVLGGLLVGPGRAGQLFYEYRHNPLLAATYDEPRFFPTETDGFDALRICISSPTRVPRRPAS